MNTNFIREKLSSNEPILGIWSLIPAPPVIEILGRSGVDFLLLDMEHGPFDLPSLEQAILACEVSSCASFVRVPSVSPAAIQSALDVGVKGIVVPRITGITDAEEAIACMHFPPTGKRGFNPFTRAFQYAPEHADLMKPNPVSCLIIEDQRALEQLPHILALPHLDILYIGVYDLCVALGYKGNVKHPQMCALVDTLITAITAAGKVAGLMVRSEEEARHALDLGARMIVWTVDTFLLRLAADEVVQSFRNAKAHICKP